MIRRDTSRAAPATLLLASFAAVLSGGLSAPLSAQDPGDPSPRAMTVDDVLALRTASGVEISPDGSWVTFVVSEADMEADRTSTNVWIVPSDGGPEDARRLTVSDLDDSPTWHPGGEWLAFGSSRNGERQVYGIRPDGGEAWQVTSHASAVDAFVLSPDGSRLGFLATPPKSEADEELEKLRGRPIVQDSAYADQWTHLYVAEMNADGSAGEATRWSRDGLHVESLVWSPDSRSVAFGARPSPVLRTRYGSATYVQDGPRRGRSPGHHHGRSGRPGGVGPQDRAGRLRVGPRPRHLQPATLDCVAGRGRVRRVRSGSPVGRPGRERYPGPRRRITAPGERVPSYGKRPFSHPPGRRGAGRTAGGGVPRRPVPFDVVPPRTTARASHWWPRTGRTRPTSLSRARTPSTHAA